MNGCTTSKLQVVQVQKSDFRRAPGLPFLSPPVSTNPACPSVWVDFSTLHTAAWSVPPIVSLSRSPRPHLSLTTDWCLARNRGIDVIVNFNKIMIRRSLTEPCRMSSFQSDPSISHSAPSSSLVTAASHSVPTLNVPLEKSQKHRKRPISQTLLGG